MAHMQPRRRPLPLVRAAAGAALAALVAQQHLASAPQPQQVPVDAPEVPEVWATDIDAGGAPRRGRDGSLRPYEGQKKAPCTSPLQREVSGHCWIATEHKPPCPAGVDEHAGLCLIPVRMAERPRTSFERTP